ncbi:uncharacterized protein LOC107022240 [Solanum pennellii]|uniref:Uncharacterized protein LOC107022240 n=1 Tax=Solanum pennellii TaxID=28526 RepID=A0ABM1VC81_SOLPN|nr:uncharacterized protein LOC107022240 [Solanum pennellii]
MVSNDLKERFDTENGPRVFQLHREIATQALGTSSISSYFTKLKDMLVEFDSLVPCPGSICPESRKYDEHYQYQRLLQILTGLNKTYSQARSQILMMIPIPNINKAYAMLVSEESQRNSGKVGDNADGISLFSSNGPQQGFLGLGSSGKSAPTRSSGPLGPYGRGNYKGKNGHLFCDYCKWKGHTRETCYKLQGFPEDSKPKKKNTYSPQYSANVMLVSAGPNLFTCRNSQQKDVSSSSSNHGGYIMFTREQYDQILKMFHKEDLPNGVVKGIGKEVDGLYNIQMPVKEKHKSHTMTTNTITSNEENSLADIEIWHRRLGHIPAKVLKQISTLKFQRGCSHIQPCNVFPLQGKLDCPFQIVQTQVVNLFTPYMVMFGDHIECLVMMVVDFFSH